MFISLDLGFEIVRKYFRIHVLGSLPIFVVPPWSPVFPAPYVGDHEELGDGRCSEGRGDVVFGSVLVDCIGPLLAAFTTCACRSYEFWLLYTQEITLTC